MAAADPLPLVDDAVVEADAQGGRDRVPVVPGRGEGQDVEVEAPGLARLRVGEGGDAEGGAVDCAALVLVFFFFFFWGVGGGGGGGRGGGERERDRVERGGNERAGVFRWPSGRRPPPPPFPFFFASQRIPASLPRLLFSPCSRPRIVSNSYPCLTCAVSAQRSSCEMMSALGMNAGISIDEMSLPSEVAAAAMTTLEFLLAEDGEERPLKVLRAAGADADTFEEAPRRRRAGLEEASAATGRDDDDRDEAEAEEEEATAFSDVGDRQARMFFGLFEKKKRVEELACLISLGGGLEASGVVS